MGDDAVVGQPVDQHTPVEGATEGLGAVPVRAVHDTRTAWAAVFSSALLTWPGNVGTTVFIAIMFTPVHTQRAPSAKRRQPDDITATAVTPDLRRMRPIQRCGGASALQR